MTGTSKANTSLLKIINVLASLAPDHEAVELLRKFRRTSKNWRPDFAALTFIAYITEDPDNWPSYLAELRADFKDKDSEGDLAETKLHPKIFFTFVANTLGVERIAKQLCELDLKSKFEAQEIDGNRCIAGEIDADKWFVDKLLGLSNSPLLPLSDKNGKWCLLERQSYPVGERFQ